MSRQKEPCLFKSYEGQAISLCQTMFLSEAIATVCQRWRLVYAAGFTHLIPFAAGHEIIRQGRKNLILARATPDLIYDQMVAAGCARKVIFSYMGNPGWARCAFVRTEIEAGSWNGKSIPILA